MRFTRAIAVLCFTAAIAAAQSAVPIPQVTGPIPVTADSYPFMTANRIQEVVDLSKHGYVEEEFFLSGTANVYDWTADGSLAVKTANAPYKTRILVRRPADAGRFSGTVIVEPVNNARAYDWEFLWAYSYDYFMEHGDAWIAVTHFPVAIASLKKFNAARYGSLAMANPNPQEACGPRNGTSDSEEGLRWDIFSQLAALFKSKAAGRPLANFNVQRVFGTSHFSELTTYMLAVHPHATLENGKPAYDGYLIKSPEDPGRINRCASAPAEGDPRQLIRNVNVPVIRMITQGDVPETSKRRRPDSDESGDRFRLYEVAGASHIDTFLYHHMPVVEDQVKAGATPFLAYWPLTYQCEPEIPLYNLPVMRYAVDAAFASLDRWVRDGIPAPRAERIGLNVTDKFGNAVGGVRSPYLDVPAATYYSNTAGQVTCHNIGRVVPFDWAKMEALYGSSRNYAAKVAQSVDRLVKERWLTESDGRQIKADVKAR